jgi:dihydrofolate synthase / folylpolyglutamate synthase
VEITPIRLSPLVPPKDELVSKICASKLRLRNGDILAVSSKVVSISEGRCVPTTSTTKAALIKKESQLFYAPKKTAKWGYQFTITQGILCGSAGIDQSNGNGYFVLWPKDPRRSANKLRTALMKHYKLKKLGVVITDSTSRPLRRGAMGFALAWAGLDPLHDYRGTRDIFGQAIRVEQANTIDGLAAAAVLMMGEGSEQTPIALIRNAPERVFNGRHSSRGWNKFIVPLKDDLFAPFLNKAKWQKGGEKK